MKKLFKLLFSVIPEIVMSITAWYFGPWILATFITVGCALISYNVYESINE